MSRDDYRKHMLQALQSVQHLTRDMERKIGRLYARCASEMALELESVDEKSLRHRRDSEVINALKARTREMWVGIGEMTKQSMKQAADISINAFENVYHQAAASAGLEWGNSFRAIFAATPDDAVATVLSGGIYGGDKASLSKRIWKNEALLNGQIEQLIAEGIAKGQSPMQLAKALEAYVNPKAEQPDHWNEIYEQLPFPAAVDYNAKRLTVAAINHAGWCSMISAAKADPFAEYIHWELSTMHHVQDICDLYAKEDQYGLGIGNHPIDQCPLPHPFCRCTYYPDSGKSLKEIGTNLRGWLDGTKPSETLDKAFANWSKPDLLRYKKTGSPITGDAGGLPPEIDRMYHATMKKIGEDFPGLSGWVQDVCMGDEGGGAAITRDGRHLLLDRSWFGSEAKAKQKLLEMVSVGHTGATSDPRFIIAHELGHAIHSMAAFHKSNLVPDALEIAWDWYDAAYKEVLIDAIANSGIDGSTEEVLRQIGDEMGSRAVSPLTEMIAQACAMCYYGDGKHPLSDRVIRYMMQILTE